MSIRIPIGQAAVLFEDGAADFAPAPADRTVRFGDTPVDFAKVEIATIDDQILIGKRAAAQPKLMPGRKYH